MPIHRLLSQRAGERKEEGEDLLLVINKAAGDNTPTKAATANKEAPEQRLFPSLVKKSPLHITSSPDGGIPGPQSGKICEGRTTVEEESKSEGSVQARSWKEVGTE